MNKVCAGLLCIFLTCGIKGQDVTGKINISAIKPYALTVNDIQTVNLIFPYAVRRVHCASKELEIEQMKDVKNILLVRSIGQGFSPTNLSVVTNDGRFYSFALAYANEPALLNVRLQSDSIHNSNTSLADVPLNEALLESSSLKVQKQEKFLRLVKRNQLVKFSLDGIFVHNGLMWLAMTVTNGSLIDYSFDYVKVFVRDRVRSKKTIIQEKEMRPVFVQMENAVKGSYSSRVVMAFEPFAIPFEKILAIQMAEKTGGRYIELRAASHVFYKTRAIID